MIRHFISGFLLPCIAGIVLAGCAPSMTTAAVSPPPPPQSAPQTHVNKVKLTTQSSTPSVVPGVNAPASVSKTVRVALLLPLTGRHSDMGRAMQDAATVGLYDKYASLSLRESTVRVELLPKDTGDSAEQVAAAAREAISDGAALIIGPLFAEDTDIVAPIARSKNIPVISLSNKAGATGDGVFYFGFSPHDQTTRIVNYAVKQGKTRIAVLVPNSPLGELVTESTKAALASYGLSIAGQGTYVNEGLGVDTAVNQLFSSGAANFDALLLPEGGASLPTILRALAARGVTPQNVQFLGTGIWDDPALLRSVSLDGAWLATLPPENTNLFEKRFRSSYKYEPPRITGLAYDAVSLAVTLATSGNSFTVETLTNDAGFVGPANGFFLLRKSGKTDRALSVLQVSGDSFRVLDQPRTNFVRR